MFHQGSICDGIAASINDRKIVACFVVDSSMTSYEWENILNDPQIATTLQEQAVVLKIESQSREAELLSEWCNIVSVPCFIVIDNGKVVANLTTNLPNKDFISYVSEIFRQNKKKMDEFSDPAAQKSKTSPEEHSKKNSWQPEQSGQVQRQIPCHFSRTRHEYDTQEVAPTQPRVQSAADPMQHAMLELQETDGGELQIKRETHRELTDYKVAGSKPQSRQGEDSDGIQVQHLRAQPQSPAAGARQILRHSPIKECAICVRLFDGHSIRSRFLVSTNLEHVRQWIDFDKREGIPYTFRHVISPGLNRDISISEEQERLDGLNLFPSATLVLIPIRTYAEAYCNRSGLIIGGLSTCYATLSSGLGFIGRAVRSLTPTAKNESEKGRQIHPGLHDQLVHVPTNSASNFHTLRDGVDVLQNRSLYNGNQLSVQPREDEGEIQL